MTLEEALAASVVEPVNDIFEINPETRVITVPASEKLFGVANDGNSERKHFRCPKIVGDNIDLSTMHLYINYQNANGQKYPYLVEDIRTDGDYITFSWLIGPDVVAYKGQIKFIVCAKKGDGTIPEWNTTLAEGTVLEGLEATNEVVARNPDIIEQILTRLDNVTEIPQEKVSSAVEEYMAKNPINIPKKLPNPHKLTFAGAVTAEYDGTIYKVLQAHTSQDTWIPPDAPSLFAKVLIPNENVIPEWEQPDSTNPYAKGDKVTHNGKTWISTADGNVWEPGVYGWEEVHTN